MDELANLSLSKLLPPTCRLLERSFWLFTWSWPPQPKWSKSISGSTVVSGICLRQPGPWYFACDALPTSADKSILSMQLKCTSRILPAKPHACSKRWPLCFSISASNWPSIWAFWLAGNFCMSDLLFWSAKLVLAISILYFIYWWSGGLGRAVCLRLVLRRGSCFSGRRRGREDSRLCSWRLACIFRSSMICPFSYMVIFSIV